ncbi:ABC transporter substrate-binding protein [Marvinbryantia formatexigens]|nr:ABC transporter substrate-binding protein [Marvinbryantia formatexigens]UWO24122.1 ABC transporter substrate-binding protein [Marvinbryantia formatexigens DSM 14469]SDG69508.1 ABC-type glycerol-3-phosphate transport system, substrate-binding protein [Marvinbryantia formatexigens]
MRRNGKRRIAAILAAAVLAAGVAGCGNTQDTTDTQQNTVAAGAESAGADTQDDAESAGTDAQDGAADTAADKNQTAQSVAAEGSTAMGRYMESEIALPEEIRAIYDQQELEDGTLRVLSGGDTTAVWESGDGGASWEKKLVLNELEGLEDKFISAAKFSPDGSICCAFYKLDAEETAQGGVGAAGEDAEAAGGDAESSAEAAGENAEAAGGDAESSADDGVEAAVPGGVEAAGEEGAEAADGGMDTADAADDGIAAGGDAGADMPDCMAKILPDGTLKMIPVKAPFVDSGFGIMIMEMSYMETGKILVNCVGQNQLYLLDDESGEVLATYNEEDEYCFYFKTGGGRIFLFGTDGVTVLDYATGEESAADDAIKETLEDNSSNLEITSSMTYPVIMCSGSREGTLYFANEDGIYRYSAGGSVVEQIADGELNSLGKPSISLCSMAVLSDGSFLLSVLDETEPKLLHFVYDESVPTVPDTELKVYALEDNAEVQQAISMFQTQNPKYYVNLEIGMSGDDAVTASDALRTLNTEIMAGNGPDVLILDGMPMDSYIEKGVLKDISGIYNEILQSDGLQENIAGTWQRDGAVYAIPSRFRVPVLMGDTDTIAQIENLEDLGSVAEQLRAEDDGIESIVEVLSAYWLQKVFYGVYSPTLLADDGTLDTEALTGYLTELNTLFHLNHYTEEEVEHRMVTENDDPYDFSDYVSVEDWAAEKLKLQVISLSSGYNLATVTSVCASMENMDYRLAPVGDKKVFTPAVIVGVSAKSSQTEGAEEFVKFMLSEAAQSINQGGGFPVNKKALDTELFADKLADGQLSEDERSLGSFYSTTMDEETGIISEFSFETVVPEQEVVDRFKELVDSLDTPSLTDAVMEELVQEQAGKCITGEVTVEEAVSSISQKMNLYLAE